MDMTLIKLAIERLSEEVERLKTANKEQQQRILQLEKQDKNSVTVQPNQPRKTDELLTLMQVKQILSVGRNSILKLVKEGQLNAIKINRRSVRYSHNSVMKYIAIKNGDDY